MFSIVQHMPVTYGNYVYPGWAVGVGWMFAICSMVPLPVLALVRILKAKGSLNKVSTAAYTSYYRGSPMPFNVKLITYMLLYNCKPAIDSL